MRRTAEVQDGLTFVELLMGTVLIGTAIVAMLGVSVTHVTMNAYSRDLSLAADDATRVAEQLRRQNTGSGCMTPSVAVTGGFTSWDAWLADTGSTGGGGKSLQPNAAPQELVTVSTSGTNPLVVTVAVCWRQRDRVFGECTWNGTTLTANPGAGGDPAITESPAMVSTRLACRNT
jgi:hypothetical protein